MVCLQIKPNLIIFDALLCVIKSNIMCYKMLLKKNKIKMISFINDLILSDRIEIIFLEQKFSYQGF